MQAQRCSCKSKGDRVCLENCAIAYNPKGILKLCHKQQQL
ncbi:hypothetical protein GXM_08705 [Nostoc sphaeroides CCNUC1]|uniref:Uncharacterized protein n=1 Tax=Nostoc sphaeroides CCNUC1 TaxID=2653204 RepID=A0A5P8WF68_9NOSO|nr:hypothetical protein GXM_08705 [Nostoc sphaeroides CCNUC1]